MRNIVVFVTDYGLEDSYAAALVGAVARVDPAILSVAGTHAVPLGDMLAGAYHVKALAQAFGPGTVICAVVDPEVGTARRALAATAAGVGFVGPDTGLLSYLWGEVAASAREAVALELPAGASATFAGRDLFAPVAARLAAGVPLGHLGEAVAAPVVLAEAFASREVDVLCGRVAVVDHFGNAITTVRSQDLSGDAVGGASWEGGAATEVVRTYAEISGGLGVLVGSTGHVEIAARGASAAAAGGPPRGAKVQVSVRFQRDAREPA